MPPPRIYREFPKYVTGPDGCPTAQTIEEERYPVGTRKKQRP